MSRVFTLVLTIGLAGFLLFPLPAWGQDLAPGLSVDPDSNTARLYPEVAPAPSLRFALGEIVGPRDIQGGKVVPGLPQLNALDVGAGNAAQPGRLGIGADVSGSIVFHARRPAEPPVRLATMTPDGVTFDAPVSFHQPVYGVRVPVVRLRLRVARLERRVARLRSVLRRVLNGRP